MYKDEVYIPHCLQGYNEPAKWEFRYSQTGTSDHIVLSEPELHNLFELIPQILEELPELEKRELRRQAQMKDLAHKVDADRKMAFGSKYRKQIQWFICNIGIFL